MKRISPNSLTCSLKTLAFFSVFLISPFCQLSHAAVITVPGDYSTIQAAIDVANESDEIIVSPGTYYENINFNGKNIILRSTDPTNPDVVAGTIIDGDGNASVATFSGTELATCVLSGFTITNGYALKGGGILGNQTLATLQHNTITTNTAYENYPDWYNNVSFENPTLEPIQDNESTTCNASEIIYIYDQGLGGGVYSCNGVIQNNTITGNDAYFGGGIASCNGTIQHNTISNNSATEGGGASFCRGRIQHNIISKNTAGSGGGLGSCDGTIQSNIISENSAIDDGGGLSYCRGQIRNNIISWNSASDYGGGLYSCSGILLNNTIYGNSAANRSGGGVHGNHGFIINCIVWSNIAPYGAQIASNYPPLYSCIQDWGGGGIGNISSDPKLVDPANGNYHLQPDSPCIDAGNTYYVSGEYIVDTDGECRVLGSSVDMGCDEYGSSLDTDGDLLADVDEDTSGTNRHVVDTDGDGLIDGVEVLRGTSPLLYDTPGTISIPAQYPRIQQAIFLAFPSEVISISPGTYYENLHFFGKNLVLQSINPFDDNITSNTVIDGSESFSVISLEGKENETCAIRGITIRNGYAIFGGGVRGNGSTAKIEHNRILNNKAGSGGGLYGCNGPIQNNIISNNFADGRGGGLYRCFGTIENNIISGNTAYHEDGGGLYNCGGTIQNNIISDNSAVGRYYKAHGGGLSECDGTIQNNVISSNRGYDYGGAFYECDGLIQNNIISRNGASYGGGFYGCDGVIQNNIIFNNGAWYGGGLSRCYAIIKNNTIYGNRALKYGGGLHECYGYFMVVINCIIWKNTAPSGAQMYGSPTPYYSCIPGWIGGGTGNISVDPQLVDPDNGNLHLLPTSPCIDAGGATTLSQDFEGDPRPYDAVTWESRGDGSDFDIGADEFIGDVPEPTPTPTCIPCVVEVEGYIVDPTTSLPIDGALVTVFTESHEQGEFTDEMGYYHIITPVCSTVVDATIVATADGYCEAWVERTLSCGQTNYQDFALTPISAPPPTTCTCTIYVPQDYPAIQEAIDAAHRGCEIIVSPGIYIENINFGGKNIILRSTDPTSPTVVASTIIDGNQAGSVVTFSGTEYSTCTLSGFTITKGYTLSGGGIYGNGTMATIQYNIVTDNIAYWLNLDGSGGGISRCNGLIQYNTVSGNFALKNGGGLAECNGTIQYNTISDNSGYYGGGLYECNGTIQYNTISDNGAYGGGGLYLCEGTIQHNIISENSARICGGLSNCDAIIQNNIVSNNYGTFCGGLYTCNGLIQNNIISGNRTYNNGGGLYRCHGTIQNNIIYRNSARLRGGGLFYCNGIIENNTLSGNSADYGGGLSICNGIIRNCIIWQNTGTEGAQIYLGSLPSYSCIQDWSGGGPGNISFDPQLVGPDIGDFHLQPISPCIDAGSAVTLAQDFEGDSRPYDAVTWEIRGDGSNFDIGADEYIGMIPLKDYDFDLTDEEWTSVTLPSYFTPPACYYLPSHVILSAQDNSNTYGFWTSEADAVPVIADCLYRARWTVATDVTDPLAVPHIQLRINSQNLQQADILVVSSTGDGSYSPTPDGRTYEMYFVPPESALGKPEDQDDLILSFDILNFDPVDAADGSLMLDRVVVDAIPLETLSAPTLLKTWSFDTDAEGWQFGSAPIFFTPPTSNINSGALWLTALNNTNTFGFWSGPSEVVQAEAGKLYRLRFTVSTDVTVQEQVPQLRLRVSSEDFQSSIMKVISSFTGAEMSPIPSGRTYDLYFYPPQSLVGTDADSIIVAFDILNFDPADASSGALMLDSVLVESLNIP